MITARRPRSSASAWILLGCLLTTPALGAVQDASSDVAARKLAARLHALEDEADRLAAQARTAVDAIHAAEVERDRQQAAVVRAAAERRGAEADLALLRDRIAALKQTDALDEPLIAARLVALYKHGRGSYLRLLFAGGTLQDVGRAARTIASLVDQNAARITERLDQIAAAEHEAEALTARLAELDAARSEAEAAREAAVATLAEREAASAALDRRRDANAQLLGSLRAAAPGATPSANGPAPARVPPLAAFKGVLDWPVVGPIASRFHQGRTGGAAGSSAAGSTANGITISAPAGTPVLAVHPGVVTYAEPFAGLGTLVILDHGSGYLSAYGLLRSTPARKDQHVAEGEPIGVVAEAAAGGRPALYFEIRADGQPTDPIQWLRPR